MNNSTSTSFSTYPGKPEECSANDIGKHDYKIGPYAAVCNWCSAVVLFHNQPQPPTDPTPWAEPWRVPGTPIVTHKVQADTTGQLNLQDGP